MAPELFSFWDILLGFSWATIIVSIAFYFRIKNKDKAHYKYLLPAVIFKLVFGFLFGLTYAKILDGGGDTLAYWEGAIKLNNLFWHDTAAYFEEMFRVPDYKTISHTFSSQTGYPPAWIYKEPESFFICKILSVFTFLTFNSYLALTFIFSGFVTLASWKFFETIQKLNISSNKWIILATLFVPTLAFWCSGISKDTVILGAIFLVIHHLFAFIDPLRRPRFTDFLLIIFYGFVLFKIRPFMLIAIIPPLFLAYGTSILKGLSQNTIFLFVTRLAIISFSVVISYLYFSNSSNLGNLNPDKYLEEVVIIQQDFSLNKTYTGYRYDLKITDYSPIGLIAVAPMAIITSFYRPFLWEANSGFLFLSAIEGTILLYLTLAFFFLRGGLKVNFRYLRQQEILIFSVFFVIIFGFFVGFTSGLFNVLVRFKAPLIPFLILILSSPYSKDRTSAFE